MPINPIEIQCPVKGTWSFLNPPGHHPDAKDFVAVDVKGKPYKAIYFAVHVLWKMKAAKVYAWESEVSAPFDGEIIAIENGCDDRESLNLVRDVVTGLLLARKHDMNDTKFFFGNHVIMQSNYGIYALFAHLRKDSIKVKKGGKVKTGDIIAAIGNSGNTIQPHLHFQLMKENNPITSPPLPFVFSRFETKQQKTWKTRTKSLPRNRQVFHISGK